MKRVTLASAARKLIECVDRVYSKHESFELVKNGIPRAHLVPANGAFCNSHELTDALGSTKLGAENRRALASALGKGRKALKRLANPWR